MSSTVTIGFLDRTRVCIEAEFTPPIADDERRELLIHAALLTGRAFAALSYERQGALAGVLRGWIAARFETCPLQIVDGDPMACPQRFASTFLAPVREYALATIGCSREAGGIDYFLPMAAVAYLRYVTVDDHDPEELLQPALALCAAVAIHPITLANHFQMSAASLPKVGPVVARTVPAELVDRVEPSVRVAKRRLRDARRTLIMSACLAALAIIGGVQYLSTREPNAKAPPPAPASPPQRPAALPPEPYAAAPQSLALSPRKNIPAPKALSPQARVYLREIRDLAENSLAQVEVMAAATDRQGMDRPELAETLDFGTWRLQTWRRQFALLIPPRGYQPHHREIGLMLTDLGGIAQTLRAPMPESSAEGLRERLSRMHDRLGRVLNDLDAG